MAATKTASKAVEAADVVEDVKELVEDTVELVGGKTSWTGNPKFLLMSALSAGVVIGSAATYLVVRKKLEAKFQTIADEQVADVKEHYSLLRKENVSLEDLAAQYPDEDHDKAAAIIAENGYSRTPYERVLLRGDDADTVTDEVPEQTVTEAIMEAAAPIERNVFESDQPDTYFDFEEELSRREDRPDDPFVITQEEFNDNETDNDQSTLTYYDGDDVLADSNDQPVDNIDGVVGVENMLRFGHGSGDPNIVYIRNARLGLDMEIVHSDGKFAKEVLGFDDELTHSNTRKPRKFRDSDD